MLHGRFNVDQPLRSSRQVVDTLFLAGDLTAVVVFQGEAYPCHREVSWVSAFRYWKASTLTRKLTLCPGLSPNFLQEALRQECRAIVLESIGQTQRYAARRQALDDLMHHALGHRQ